MIQDIQVVIDNGRQIENSVFYNLSKIYNSINHLSVIILLHQRIVDYCKIQEN